MTHKFAFAKHKSYAANPTRSCAGFLPGRPGKFRVHIRENPRKAAFRSPDHRITHDHPICFLRVSVVGFVSKTKTAAQVRAAVFPTKERPQSALEKIEKIIYCTFTFSVSR
jgi:hypothetical protein